MIRSSVMVAASDQDADAVKEGYPQFRNHAVLTPPEDPRVLIDSHVWTPAAMCLSASVRLRLRGQLSGLIDEFSVEEDFPHTLLSW